MLFLGEAILKKISLFIIIINLFILAAVSYYFFFAINYTNQNIQYKYTVGAAYRNLDNSYYYTLHNKITNVLTENNCLVINRNCKNSGVLQNQQIINLIDLEVDALLITPINSTNIEKALLYAKDKHVVIIIIDNPVKRDDLVNCTIHSDNINAGKILGIYLKNNVSNLNIIVLSDDRSISARNRIAGFESVINNFQDAKIIKTINTEDSDKKSMEAIDNLIEKGINFNIIFSINDICALGAYASIKKHNITHVKILSVDGSPKGKLMVKNGNFYSTVLQYPDILGEKGAKAILSLLGDNTVFKDMTVPVKLITKNTIRSYDLEKWE